MDIDSIKTALNQELEAVKGSADLEALRVKYLGRKGALAQMTGSIPSLPPEQRGVFGKQVNELKNHIGALLDEKQKTLGAATSACAGETADMGMPGIAQDAGRRHVLTQIIDEICGHFERMGFIIKEGLEVETEYNNFTGLNIPLEHPSREAFDTFYLKGLDARLLGRPASDGKLLLRSQTSSVQIQVMKANKPPLAIVAPGRVYRPDAVDASHSFMFHQIEGFLVDKGVKFSDLKGTLEFFAKAVFGRDIKMRFRPHFFPFTEPSAEIDISCIICKGKGCSVCGKKGWLEILGSGMIHPNVFKNVGYDPKAYTGFAFGMGVERIAMLKYGINDIRLFYENDLRFLRQF
ncbi:MAG: phenylalanine--tRNA ligase subunit alpha [Candidatus Omnitrophica bacterium]|jgi:phenylalanyl-tRNA synthetase alpha chain|nr:phenylalanine--tRNA ligase subunit alpha [Candidatus Omnitrophota bacterium]